MYTNKALQHFKKPKNMGRIENPDAIGEVGNVICGDVMKIYLKIGKNKSGQEIIKDIKFETYGCVAAIATSSVLTELAKGKTLDQALKIDNQTIINALGNLPAIKIHCSVLAANALAEAIYNYFTKNNREIPEFLKQKHASSLRATQREHLPARLANASSKRAGRQK
ncbi:iron-sulfur cluster assembly scaffold protein [Candidatus Falkowbacteria bacterium]|nr:iron-sulfur cluster assembly scaffold protein [Candidatus Falkowbacteria bacterium]